VETRRRRGTDAVLLGLAAAAVGAVAVAAAVLTEPERITRLWTGAVVGGDGAARIVESIDTTSGPRSATASCATSPAWTPATRSRCPRPPPPTNSR
jgi:hypothetical protein